MLTRSGLRTRETRNGGRIVDVASCASVVDTNGGSFVYVVTLNSWISVVEGHTAAAVIIRRSKVESFFAQAKAEYSRLAENGILT